MGRLTSALVLAGGHDQIELIRVLRERYEKIFLADYLDNPPAVRYADKHFQISTLDVQSVKDLAAELKVQLVAAACTDQALLTAAIVAEELALPFYISPETALKLTNKMYMKEMFARHGIPSSRYIIISKNETVCPLDFNFPVVVKPVDCNSSKGVLKVYENDSLGDAINAAMGFSRSKNVIIEEYVGGIELSIDAYAYGGSSIIISVTENIKSDDGNNFTIIQSKYPANINKEVEKEIKIHVDSICRAFNLDNCPLLIQAICYNDRLSIIEFSARLGGGSKYCLIETVSGIQIMKANVQSMLGEIPDLRTSFCKNYARINFCYCHNGKFYKLKNFEELKTEGIIDDYFLYKLPGASISGASTSSDRIAGYILSDNNERSLFEKQEMAISRLKILSDSNENILRSYSYK